MYPLADFSTKIFPTIGGQWFHLVSQLANKASKNGACLRQASIQRVQHPLRTAQLLQVARSVLLVRNLLGTWQFSAHSNVRQHEKPPIVLSFYVPRDAGTDTCTMPIIP